jgi:hypothetical protein
MRLSGFLLITLLSAVGPASPAWSQAPGNADSPAAVVSVSGADPADPDESDPQAIQLLNLERNYEISLASALRDSSNPRDWVALALSHPLSTDEAEQLDLNKLTEKARLAAPDDLLVQWIALRLSTKPVSVGIDHAAALAAVQRLEPDNAAVWMETLAQASQRQDSAAVDETLIRMAASTRSDEHLADLMKAQLDFYERYPMPEAYYATLATIYPNVSPGAMRYVSAMAVVSAIALPAYQWIVKACTINSVTGENLSRSTNCTTIGRLMAARGSDLLTNRIGSAVLRVAGTYTEADIAQARTQDWIYQQDAAFLQANYPEQVAHLDARMNDWIESRSELEAMRREIARAGKADTPPTDWADDRSPLSPSRLHPAQISQNSAAQANH